jgi:hypothetical protein
MKPLPIHSIPANRMGRLTRQAAFEQRQEKLARVRARWEGNDPDTGCGSMAAVGLIVAMLVIYAVAGLWIILR